MKNTNLQTYGNNYPSNKFRRILIPLFTQENPQAVPGVKYYFPENPEIDKYNIVGMEAHIVRQPTLAAGDIKDQIIDIVTQASARDIYLNLYNEKNEETFFNLPLRSLFTYMPFAINFKVTKRIKPIKTKLKTRSCFAYIPANIGGSALENQYISLTIYYN